MDFAQTCIGTPYYMSPEIFKNKPYSYKSDVWALGCVLYEMTTLNHAFDANSLNGLAQKIIKGRYPAIHHKYSRYLRELIGHMLLPEPKQRPDLDQILRKPFIKKHILQFFQDISSRPSEGIGEGTMIVRAAAGGPVGAMGNDANMLSFREQLDSLGMTQAISEVMAPISKRVPQDEGEAKKIAKEAANALKREQDHRKMVESALEKLRKERESRARERMAGGGGGRRVIPKNNNSPSGLKKDGPPSKPAALRQPRQGGMKYDVGNGGIAAIGGHARRSASEQPSHGHHVGKGRRQSEARDRQIAEDRDRRLREAQEKQEELQREKEREEEAKRRRDEMMAKAAREQARQQADIAARREAQRERERIRQAEEIEQLKRDKLELDKRSRDRDVLREQRRREERARLEGQRKEQMENVEDKLGEMNEAVGRLDINKRVDDRQLSAREKVLLRKQEKQAKEDAERQEALLAAEEENRRIRMQAYNQQHSQFHGDLPPRHPVAEQKSPGANGADEKVSEAKNIRKERASLGMDELTAKLHNARGAPRYGRGVSNVESAENSDSDEESQEEELWGEEDPTDAQEEEEIIRKREEELQAELANATKRCQELKETLQVTKSFIDGKGKGLAAGDVRTKIVDDVIPPSDDEYDDDDDAAEYDEEDEIGNSWEEQSCKSVSSVPATDRGYKKQESGVETPRVNRPNPIAVRQVSYKNLVDAPSPCGRLGDRIVRLKQRCILALGRRAFDEAYAFLKQHAADDSSDPGDMSDEGDSLKQKRVKEILGPDKAHYMPLIDQLIFMEDTHSG
eukprot:CAMPEP_0185029364 /NCGR_PEP_ID=MMETSP1103-20130426/15636_1 /TAXON_ID=36769 /ORGANISM="Paraphysomonas bandaiensis, Strain Caron Lab Isolate" /LENGTH=798 /DNA_ID=CAMNT_0027564075 /DNA_START=684 /DNA_END=3080 /DNA_ORIENTATION=+